MQKCLHHVGLLYDKHFLYKYNLILGLQKLHSVNRHVMYGFGEGKNGFARKVAETAKTVTNLATVRLTIRELFP